MADTAVDTTAAAEVTAKVGFHSRGFFFLGGGCKNVVGSFKAPFIVCNKNQSLRHWLYLFLRSSLNERQRHLV